ncbi:hypothetical protein [Aquifex sp.]
MDSLREAIKERVRFYTELIKILWLLVLAVGGGTAGLFLKGLNSPKSFILFSAGIFIVFLSLLLILKLVKDANSLLKRLEEEDG